MPWVSIIVLLPLLGALSMLAVPDAPGGLRQARIQAIATVAGTAVFTGILIGLFDQSVPGLQYIDHVSWADEVGLAWDVERPNQSLLGRRQKEVATTSANPNKPR